MSEVVLDSSALLALMNNEKGVETVAEYLPGAIISAINLSEVVCKLCSESMPENTIRQDLNSLGLNVIPFDEEQAYRAGLLYKATKSHGISFGDRACLNLGRTLGTVVLTADKMWVNLNIDVKIKLIR